MFTHSEFFDAYELWWTPEPADEVIIVGGGRWGKLWANVIIDAGFSHSKPKFISSSLLSDGNSLGDSDRHGAIFANFDSLDEIRKNSSIVPHLIIANSLDARVSAANALNERKWPALIEKPVAATYSDTCSLLKRPSGNDAIRWPGHTLLFAPYLYEFKRKYENQIDQCDNLTIEWQDPGIEHKHGESKTINHSVPLLVDVWPHIDSIVQVLLGVGPTIKDVGVQKGSLILDVEAIAAGKQINISLARHAEIRKRSVVISGTNGRDLCLDFSIEEKTAVHQKGARPHYLSEAWNLYPSPLRLQFGCFLQETRSSKSERSTRLIKIALDAAEQAEKWMPLIANSQWKLIESQISAGTGKGLAKFSNALCNALVQRAGDKLPFHVRLNPFDPYNKPWFDRLLADQLLDSLKDEKINDEEKN